MLENKEGQKVPQVTFKIRENHQWKEMNSDDLFKNKKIVFFALPGAYTPTCSSTHLPRYNELAKVFKEYGIDEIICLSVNDTFVMNEWAKDQDTANIRLIPDGNGEFSKGMGMLVDKSEIGFGQRSWRYSMYVEDGVIKKMFIEEEKAGDPFEVSDADTMLNYLAPNAKKPDRISLMTKKGCPHCTRAKDLLKAHDLDYEEIELSPKVTLKSLVAISGASSTPQVFINGEKIGGADALEQYLNAR